jgi:type I restriction enzyme S subunit
MQKTLPKGWKWVKLGEVSEIITGNTPSKQVNDFYDKRYANFFKPDDFNDNV